MKDLKFSGLLDVYGSLLTEKQASITEQYYHLDYSLSEIAENERITRQAVHASLKQAQSALAELEQKLGFYGKLCRIREEIEKAAAVAEITELRSALGKISELI